MRRADLAQLLILGLHRVGGDAPSTTDLETLCLLASQRGLSLELLFGISVSRLAVTAAHECANWEQLPFYGLVNQWRIRPSKVSRYVKSVR